MITVVKGNLLDFSNNVDIIVNAWNRNFIPHRLLFAYGVSKAIKQKAGYKPFDEVQEKGLLELGEGVLTSPGNLNCKGIIHVAGINIFWQSSEKAIRLSAKNIIKIMIEENFNSIAIPLIGCGTNKFSEEKCICILKEEFKEIQYKEIFIVKYKK